MNNIGLESKVLSFIQQHELVSPGETMVVAVSGGPDSVCLLHVLAKWRKKLGIKLHVAHLNHQLRGVESEADAGYASNVARSLGIPSTIDRQDVAAYRTERKCSLEEAAREIRYAFLARVAREVGAQRIAIGHTKDDQVETILMHIIRGTGTLGLRGLEPCSPMPATSYQPPGAGCQLLVIRPLLDITRRETASYCQEHQLEPRIDSSNLSSSFFRNRLRLHLLPLLRQYNPSIDEALLRLADIAKEDNAFIEQQACVMWDEVARQGNDTIYFDKKQVAGLPAALQSQLLRMAMTKLAGDVRDIEASHIEAARTLLNKPAGKRISLPRGLVCHSSYDELIIAIPSLKRGGQLEPPPCPFPPLLDEFHLRVPGQTVFSGWKVLASLVREQVGSVSPGGALSEGGGTRQSNLVGYFDLQKTGIDLSVRQRRAGDAFQPLGMNMPKKLNEFMVDAKIPRSWRDRIPVVCSPQQIVWVVGWRIDDRVKVAEATREVLRLEFIKSE